MTVIQRHKAEKYLKEIRLNDIRAIIKKNLYAVPSHPKYTNMMRGFTCGKIDDFYFIGIPKALGNQIIKELGYMEYQKLMVEVIKSSGLIKKQ